MERLRNLLNSGVSLGELFATSTELRTTTPKSTINLSTGIILQFSENEKKQQVLQVWVFHETNEFLLIAFFNLSTISEGKEKKDFLHFLQICSRDHDEMSSKSSKKAKDFAKSSSKCLQHFVKFNILKHAINWCEICLGSVWNCEKI